MSILTKPTTILRDQAMSIWLIGCSTVSRIPRWRQSASRFWRHKAHYSVASRSTNKRNAYIALGSNLGDRIGNIEHACQQLDNSGLKVLRTSHLYETKPMYYEAQDHFINGACEVQVDDDCSPLELLARLKSIEDNMGRTKTIDKGPRLIDLDVLLYDGHVLDSEKLTIPHHSMLEREFVLRPLCDLIPDHAHPRTRRSWASYLDTVKKDPSMSPISYLGRGRTIRLKDRFRSRTQLMSILNLTPDSFSDGGRNSSKSEYLLPIVEKQINSGVSIIDIGGQSTRPRAEIVSAETELERVIPAVQTIRANFPQVLISVDTFRASVAREAVKQGADIINDVSAGTMDTEMLNTVGSLGCTYVAMHMRGDPTTMIKLTDYPEGVIPGVAKELLERIQAAEIGGIKKWRMILDPGIGFAKTVSQNLELLRHFRKLQNRRSLQQYPWLVGVSRKGFIGRITGVQEADQRLWGTAAAVTASIRGGAGIVRVHDVEEMAQVAQMADAIWRTDFKNPSLEDNSVPP